MFTAFLKRYMPRGLYGRAALILLLPVVSLQLLVSVVFIQRHYAGVTEQMTQSILLELTYILPQIDAAPDREGALQVSETLAKPLRINLGFDPVTATIPKQDEAWFYDFSGQVLIAALRRGLPAIRAVDLSDRSVVRFWVDTHQGPVEVGFARSRVSASNPHQLIVIMVVLGLIMTLISYLFLRNQLRPIKRMSAAAIAYGKGRIVPFTPTGATEVRAAGTAFLAMRNRIERQTQSRTMMLSGVSHDLRTPLTRLRLGLSLMDDAEADLLIRDVDEMQHLVDEFLDFARTDATEDMVPTDPISLVQQLVDDAARSGRDLIFAGAESGAEPGGSGGATDPVPQVLMRPMSLRRALDNLIGNALRYGSSARIGVQVLDRSVRFTVEDNGPGIPADRRDEALRPFTRLDPARNQDRGSGVGLGLAIVSDIARLHGGSLRLSESETMGGLRVDLIIAR